MITKNIPSMRVIYFSTRTTLQHISQFTASIPRQLYDDAAKLQLLPSGPLLWIYEGADGKPGTEFNLEIALPVAGIPPHSEETAIKVLPSFSCISAIHHGSWDCLFETYDRLIDDVHAKGKTLSGWCREQYIHMDLETPFNNITEVQVGI